MKLKPDLNLANRFLKVLDPQETNFTFQVFQDYTSPEGGKDPTKAKTLYGSLMELAPLLTSYNEAGCGIYVTINKVTPHQRRIAQNVEAIRAFFVDVDDGPLTTKPPIPPSIVVNGKRGPHLYYILDTHLKDAGDLSQKFLKVQKGLIDQFNSDPSIKDLPRVMRLPGFYHMKDPSDPFLVTIAEQSEHTYSLEVLERNFPSINNEPIVSEVEINTDFNDMDRGVLSWRASNFLKSTWEETSGDNTILAHTIANIKKNNFSREECIEMLEGKGEALDRNTKNQVKAIYRDHENYPINPHIPSKKKSEEPAQFDGGGSNNGWLKFLASSKFFQDLSDNENFITVNYEYKKIKRFDKKVVYNCLGKKQVEANTALSEFVYNPRNNTIHSKDDNGCAIFNYYSPPFWREDNYFTGAEIPYEEDLPEEYMKFFNHLFDGHQESIEYVINWMANAVQGNRNIPILALVGSVRGIGKNVFSYINKSLHGDSNFETVKQQIITKEFNGQMSSKTLVQFDEVSIKNEEQYEAIKVYTNPFISVEAKNKDAKTMPLCANIIMTNNVAESLAGVNSEDDRQFSIPIMTKTPMNKVAYYRNNPELYKKLYENKEWIQKLAHYLYHFDVDTDLVSHNLKTEHYYDIIKSSTYEWHHVILEDIRHECAGQLVSANIVKNFLRYSSGVNIGREKIERFAGEHSDVIKVVRIKNKRYIAFAKENESAEEFTERLTECKNNKWKSIRFVKEINIDNEYGTED